MKLISKKNIQNLLLASFAACLLTINIGCGSEGAASDMIKTSHGYKMALLEDVEGESPKEGEVLLFAMEVYANDSLLTSTFDQEYDQEFRWIPAAERDKMNNPVVDAFELMSEGDRAKVLYPADSMKGNKFGLKSGDNLVYILKVEQILNAEDYAVYAQERQQKMQAKRAIVQAKAEEIGEMIGDVLTQYQTKKLGEDLIKDDSGLEYVVHEAGNGPKPKVGEQVTVHYYGVLKSDGTMFDNSFRRGEPFSFQLGVGQVIPGWDKGVVLLNKGSKATLFIPYEMAYGAAGKPPTIPEKSDLVFYIEIPE